MATIQKRHRANGTIAYTAQIRIKRKGKIIHHESKTFDKRKAADEWAKTREVELKKPQSLAVAMTPKTNSIATLLQRYIDEIHPVKPLGTTKHHALTRMQRYEFAKKDILDLQSSDIIEFARYRRQKEKAGPHTINIDISYLRTVIAMCKPAWNIPADISVIDEAKPLLKKMNLVAAPGTRNRRLTSDEYDLIIQSLEAHDECKRSFIPLSTIFKFSIYSLMRLGEVCRIRWEDIDHDNKTVIIRQRKDPQNKELNDQIVPLLGPAWDIIKNQPIIDECIFPYNRKSISTIFNNHCKKLEIANLRYHDLRREGISRLVEMGYGVEEVATVSGHKNLSTIWKVYTQLKSEKLHDKWDRLNNNNAPS